MQINFITEGELKVNTVHSLFSNKLKIEIIKNISQSVLYTIEKTKFQYCYSIANSRKINRKC